MWRDVFVIMEKIGLTQVILPFVIIFTIVYAALEHLDLFKKDGKSFAAANAVIAFVLAFLVISATSLLRITSLLSRIFAMAVMLVLLFSILLAFFGIELEKKVKYVIPVVFSLVCITALFILANLGYLSLDIKALLNYIIYPAITVFAFILIIWFVVSGKTSAKETQPEKKKTAKREEIPEEEAPEKERHEKEPQEEEAEPEQKQKKKPEGYKLVKSIKPSGEKTEL